jgi:hypothetical protein
MRTKSPLPAWRKHTTRGSRSTSVGNSGPRGSGRTTLACSGRRDMTWRSTLFQPVSSSNRRACSSRVVCERVTWITSRPGAT